MAKRSRPPNRAPPHKVLQATAQVATNEVKVKAALPKLFLRGAAPIEAHYHAPQNTPAKSGQQDGY